MGENNKKRQGKLKEGGNIMDRKGYNKLDLSKLTQNIKFVSTEEAIKDVEPIKWSPSVVSGERQVEVRKYER